MSIPTHDYVIVHARQMRRGATNAVSRGVEMVAK